MKKILTTTSVFASTIAMALAQVVVTTGTPGQVGGNLNSFVAMLQRLVNQLVPLALGLAVASLFFGIIMFMWKGQSGDEHDKWLKWMGMSIIGLFVMVSIWGLTNFLASILGVSVGGNAPSIGIPSGPTS
jgi:hypothetical protein